MYSDKSHTMYDRPLRAERDCFGCSVEKSYCACHALSGN